MVCMNHRFAALVVLGLIALLGGCLPTYVGDPDTATVDPALVGLWHRVENDADELWAVHKMNEHTYMVQSFRIEKSGEARSLRHSLACRGWISQIGGHQFLSLEMYPPSVQLGDVEDATNRYVVARVKIAEGSLEVRGIDPAFLKGKPVERPQQLEQLIKDNIDNDDLYTSKMTYEKVNEANREKLKAVIEIIR